MNRTIFSLQDKIQRLSGENIHLGDEVKSAQESLRLSTSKAGADINQLTQRLRDAEGRVGQLTQELDARNRELKQLGGRLNEVEGKKEQATRENMSLSQRLQ
jgi:chromosome segregation ATPase